MMSRYRDVTGSAFPLRRNLGKSLRCELVGDRSNISVVFSRLIPRGGALMLNMEIQSVV